MNYHGSKSLNKGVIESKSSYLISENFFKADFEKKNEKTYDFFNSKMKSEAEFAKRFINEVVSICVNPDLLKKKNENNFNLLPESVKKAETYLNQIKVGAYSCSKGVESVRKNIAQKLTDRDKFKTEPDDIFLVYGGMDAYQHILSLFSINDTILVPSPCHPLYLTMNNCSGIINSPYTFDKNILKIEKPQPNSKAMLVINPGTPNGKILNKQEMEQIIKFCVENNIFLIASEVLQELSHTNNFLSFRSVVNSMPHPYNKLELFSFYSSSKSWLFQSSARAGYLNIMNLDSDVYKELYKHISMDICTSIPGQIVLDIVMNPPSINELLYSTDFLNNYFNSLEVSRKKLNGIYYSKIDILNDFNSNCYKPIEYPNAGFSLFIELEENNKNYNNNDDLLNATPLCEIYSKKLYEETGVFSTPGTEYGKFPNHIVFNLSNEYLNIQEMESITYFNSTFFKTNSEFKKFNNISSMNFNKCNI